MQPEVQGIARAAAARLAARDRNPRLLFDVTRYCDGASSPPGDQQYDPLGISIAALVVSAASLAWSVHRDLKADRKPLDLDEVTRRVRIELAERYPGVSANERNLIIDVVMEEFPKPTDP